MPAAKMETPIRAGDFQSRIFSSLHKAHFTTFEQLARCSPAELLALPRIGPHALAVLLQELRQRGFSTRE